MRLISCILRELCRRSTQLRSEQAVCSGNNVMCILGFTVTYEDGCSVSYRELMDSLSRQLRIIELTWTEQLPSILMSTKPRTRYTTVQVLPIMQTKHVDQQINLRFQPGDSSPSRQPGSLLSSSSAKITQPFERMQRQGSPKYHLPSSTPVPRESDDATRAAAAATIPSNAAFADAIALLILRNNRLQ